MTAQGRHVVGRGSSGGGTSVPTATQIGEVLYSTDGIDFDRELPVVSESGWLANASGVLIVVGNE